jgi:magnesium-transporting ATPase (P-type)
MEAALVDLANRALPEIGAYRRLDEIPFDADRMLLSTVHEMPSGPALWCKGARNQSSLYATPFISRAKPGR